MLGRLPFLLVSVILWTSAASAQPPWTIQATYNVPVGKMAKLSFTPNVGLKVIKIELTSNTGGQPLLFTANKLRVGHTKHFKFSAPEGRSVWTASFKGQAKDETLNSQFKFEVISVRPLKVSLEKSGVDLVKGRLNIRTNQKLATASLQGFDPQGVRVLDDEVDLPQTKGIVPIDFEPLGANALRRMEIKVTDSVGRWVSFRLVAWYVEIPHDDVEFSSGSAEIEPTEAGKLDSVVERVKKEVTAFRETLGRQDVGLNLKLYVVGCTDTIGSASDNLALSRRRARSIAQHFRARGVSAPIYYEGYGEGLLAVQTSDNVDEARNRRAIYVLTNTEPSAYARSGHRWHRLD